jgi:uncharacterized protein YbjT (DUF2867 family)
MILVTGATGFVGRTLVKQLAANGYSVRILVEPSRRVRRRRDEELPDQIAEHITQAPGSIHDIESLHSAMIGVHTIYHLASAQWWGKPDDLERIDLKGTSNLITAARSARVGRLVVMSHLGASPSSAFTLLRAKGRVEELVRASGLPFTVFRSGIVFGKGDSFVNGIARLLRRYPLFFLQPGHGEGLLHPIYIDDLVEALVRSMENLNTVDQTIEIGGPEYMTFNEMVRTVMRVTRTYRSLLSVPPHTLRMIVSVLPFAPMTAQWLDILASNRTAPLGNMFDVFGIRPVRFEDTIITYMKR